MNKDTKQWLKGVAISVVVVLLTDLFWLTDKPIHFLGLIGYFFVGYFITGYFSEKKS